MSHLNRRTVTSFALVVSLTMVSSQANAQFDLDKMLGSPVKKISQGIVESIRIAPGAVIPGATFPIDKFVPGSGKNTLPSPTGGMPAAIEKIPGKIGSILEGGSSPKVPFGSAKQANNPVSLPSSKVSGSQLPGFPSVGRTVFGFGQGRPGIGFGPNQSTGINLTKSGFPSVTNIAPAASLQGALNDLPAIPTGLKSKNPFRK
jgi:hypothetical protein